jgi:DNA-directed RNA polymerase subunit RPC12/RpoP
MAIDFRCENCGKLLSVEAKESSKIKCPHCKAKVLVPAGLASLPRPQVPGDKTGARPDQPGVVEVEEEILADEHSDALMGVMATLMPWVISLFFHAGVLVILAFFAIIVSQKKLKANVVVPDVPISENLTENIAGDMNPELLAKTLERPDEKFSNRDSKIPMTNMGETENKVRIYGSAGGSAGGARAQMGLPAVGGPKSRFCGTDGNAYHIVYVVDCSGSMLGEFEMVRYEIIKSISKLKPEQTFHVIFFDAGKPKENPPRRLVYAKVRNKRDALKYLKSVTPQSTKGYTDPILAIKRAFAVLSGTPGKRKGKLIYLLTDGEFSDNKKVISTIRTLNTKGEVHINTVLFIFANAEAEQVLKQIAKENKGKFNFVERGE